MPAFQGAAAADDEGGTVTEGPMYEDESSADVMTAKDSHGSGVPGRRIRLMRGQALIRRDPRDMGRETMQRGIIIPATAHNPRETKIHRGRIVQLGPPGVKHAKHPRAPVVPWDCAVGDEVFFSFQVWLESRRHTEDEGLVMVAQSEIQAVIEAVTHG